MPALSRSQSRSSGEVVGVMRSTMAFGNRQWLSTHAGSAPSSRAAAASVASRAASPFRGTLSQLRIVIGPADRSRRSASAAAMRSNVVGAASARSSSGGSA
jgi:hypothetical protein